MNYLNLSKDELKSTVSALNLLLANYHLYYQNLRSFHWNIQGENFFDLHIKFEGLYNSAKTDIDEIAERILTLRSKPVSRLVDYMDMAEIKEPELGLTDQAMVSEVLKNHAILINNIRSVVDRASSIDDEGTVDMVSGMLGRIEKDSWMLDAWLVGQKHHATTS